MRELKFEASVPVWVEIVPTVMEFDDTPGALLAAPAATGATTSALATSPPLNTVATSALIPCLTRIRSPFASPAASPPGCRSLYFQPNMCSLHPLCRWCLHQYVEQSHGVPLVLASRKSRFAPVARRLSPSSHLVQSCR